MRLTQIVEALLFASDAPLTAADIARIDERLDEDTVEAVVQELRGEYEESDRAFQIYEVAGGYQLLTRPDFAMHLQRFETVPQTTRLSNASLEALAIIAYRQPIGRAEVEEIRGVGSSGAIKTLADRNLIEVVGRGEGLGRPLLYGTTRKFLEHFGLRSLEDMPRPDELPVVLRTRSEPAEVANGEAPAEPAEAANSEAPAEPAEAANSDAPAEPAEAANSEAPAEPAEAAQATSEAPPADASAETAEAQPSTAELDPAADESVDAGVIDEATETVVDHESVQEGVNEEVDEALPAKTDGTSDEPDGSGRD